MGQQQAHPAGVHRGNSTLPGGSLAIPFFFVALEKKADLSETFAPYQVALLYFFFFGVYSSNGAIQ